MRTLLLSFAFFMLSNCGVPTLVKAQEPATPMSVSEETKTKSELEEKLGKVLNLDSTMDTTEDLLAQAKLTYEQAKSAKRAKSATEIALALSSILFLVLAGLRKTLGVERMSGNKVRIACILTGSVASLLGYYGGGYGAVEAVQLFMAGIGSIAINETIKLANPKKG